MKILFGPYGCPLVRLGISLIPLTSEEKHFYRQAIEEIARGYLDAGATIPTINAFFLRSLLREGHVELYKELLSLNVEALLSALGKNSYERIAICLGPANDCYQPKNAPDVTQARLFAEQQYALCLEVLNHFGITNFVFLHETIGTLREALGISYAAKARNIPLIISFIVDREGCLLDGGTIASTISQIDCKTSGFVEGYSLNCCSPYAFDRVAHLNRIIGFYPNSWDADPSTYEIGNEIKEANKIDSIKIIIEKGNQYNLKFVGGCCGFEHQDIRYLARLTKK